VSRATLAAKALAAQTEAQTRESWASAGVTGKADLQNISLTKFMA